MQYFVGIGYDCHKIIKNRDLYLGGVKFNFKYGLEGHSDADVIIHSICDAILSAAGKKDIGELFPNNNLKYKNMSSLKILNKTLFYLKNKYEIQNIDIVIICDKPKISLYKQEIIKSLKKLFGIEFINLKAKTTEGISVFKNYIQCYTVVLIRKK